MFFFSIFYTITKEKNKSPKILIIFFFLFGTKYSFSSRFIDLWNFLYIFQVKDWGLKQKDEYLKGYRECSEQRMMGKWFQSLIISLSLYSLTRHPSPTPIYTIFKIKKKV